MTSKVEIARRIRDNGYKMKCPYPDDYDGMCGIGGCEYYDFCIQANDEKVAIFNKEAVDSYIKRYDRSKSKRTVKKSLPVGLLGHIKPTHGIFRYLNANKKYEILRETEKKWYVIDERGKETGFNKGDPWLIFFPNKTVGRPNFVQALKDKKSFFMKIVGMKTFDEIYSIAGQANWKSTVKYSCSKKDHFIIFEYVNVNNKLMYTTDDPDMVMFIPEYIPSTDTFSNAESPVVKNYLTPEQRDFWEKVLINGNCDFIACSRCPYSNSYLRCVLFQNFQLDYCDREAMIAKAKEILETNDNEPAKWEKSDPVRAMRINSPVVIISVTKYEELLKIEKDYELIKKVED